MLKKIITTIFLFCLLLGNLCFLQTLSVNAQDFTPQVTMGDFKAGEKVHIDGNTLGKYIKEIYKYSIGFVGILATVVMMIGGFLWITAGGNGERVGNAKAWIGSALTGLLLALCSYTILYIVNPDLVKFKSINVGTPDIAAQTGCCQIGDKTEIITMDKCSEYRTGEWFGSEYEKDPVTNTCIKNIFDNGYAESGTCDFNSTGDGIKIEVSGTNISASNSCSIACKEEGKTLGDAKKSVTENFFCCLCK